MTCFLSYDSDSWQCFWLITFVLGCFALVLFVEFLFSASMLGWLHVSLGLELVYLSLAHVLLPVIVLVFVDFKNHVLTCAPRRRMQGLARSCAVPSRVLEELCTFVFCTFDLLYCLFIPQVATCFVLVWSLML